MVYVRFYIPLIFLKYALVHINISININQCIFYYFLFLIMLITLAIRYYKIIFFSCFNSVYRIFCIP